MNAIELEVILSENKYTQKYFSGVYSCDNLPKVVTKLPSLIICNTDKSNQPGEHWIAIYISTQRTAEFFDSFGFSPYYNKYFMNFLESNSNKILYNSKMIQSIFSNKCGYFAALFLYFRSKKYL